VVDTLDGIAGVTVDEAVLVVIVVVAVVVVVVVVVVDIVVVSATVTHGTSRISTIQTGAQYHKFVLFTCTQGSQQKVGKFQDKVFSKFQDILRSQNVENH